jgi:hypothetical protein
MLGDEDRHGGGDAEGDRVAGAAVDFDQFALLADDD